MTSERQGPFWIGFDLGGTKMMACVYDHQFRELSRCRKKTKAHEGVDAALVRIKAVIAAAIAESGLTPADISGLGIGCPGPLNLEKGIVREAPNLGWKNVPIRDTIQEEFKFPVRVGNDVDFGVFGEYEFGAARGARCAVGIFPGTGIGGGCVYEGKLLQGANCTCMEIGHIPLGFDGLLTDFATLESAASRLAISGSAAQAVFRGQAKRLASISGTDIANIRSAQLAEAIEHGDEAIKEIVNKAAEYLALGVVTMVHLLAPDVVVLGGGLVEAMPKLYVESVSKAVKKRVLPSLRDVYKILPAALGDQATAMGAAAAARQSFSN